MTNKEAADKIIAMLREIPQEKQKEYTDAVYIVAEQLRASCQGMVHFEGRLFAAAKPIFKTVHARTGEYTFGGFYEVRQ